MVCDTEFTGGKEKTGDFGMFTGSYYVAQANNMIGKITGSNYKVDKMVVAVRADDSAETIEDAADYTYGVQFEKGADNIQTAVADIEKQVGVDTILFRNRHRL